MMIMIYNQKLWHKIPKLSAKKSKRNRTGSFFHHHFIRINFAFEELCKFRMITSKIALHHHFQICFVLMRSLSNKIEV